MAYAKNALKVGGAAAGVVFVGCCFIPIVGPLVGVIAAGGTFLVVETGAVIVYGVAVTAQGIAHGVHHLHDAHDERRERRRERRRMVAEAQATAAVINNPPTPVVTHPVVVEAHTPAPALDTHDEERRARRQERRERRRLVAESGAASSSDQAGRPGADGETVHISSHRKHRHRHHQHSSTRFFAESTPVAISPEMEVAPGLSA